jgi:hypothetical protein
VWLFGSNMPKDIEKGMATPLVSDGDRKVLEALGSYRGENKRGGLGTLPDVPVGGHPGRDAFYNEVQMAVRLTVFLSLIGCMVWLPEQTKSVGMARFAPFAGLAGCLMCFFSTFSVGGVLNTASAGISGCFVACFNIWLLRGFFPDGVTPADSSTSPATIVGWLDLAIFNLLILGFNCRMGFRFTAMAVNVGFMMCFLNPADKTLFSKNFKVDPNGAAVNTFIGVCFGSLCALLSVCLPYPFGWASKNMKAAGMTASQDTCKLFIAAAKYFKGDRANVLIHRQMAQTEVLSGEIGGLGANINDAYVESLDIATQGTVRVLYEKHASMLGQILDILSALQIALVSEDFGPSHASCMEVIGEAAHDLVDASCLVLLTATKASEDGDIDAGEKEDLLAREKKVTASIQALAAAFDDARKQFGAVVSTDLMSESFFVFCLSAFGRLVVEYSTVLRTDPPTGKGFVSEFTESTKALVAIPLWYHYRVVSRYWLSLMGCFLFSVHMDNYVPSCAITGVFLINTRVGPDVMAMIQGLLAVVVGIVVNALMYSFSCRFGNTSVLQVVAVVYWLCTLTVGKGTSSLAGMGLLMAALSPFALYKFCISDSPEAQAGMAIGLWGGIRALLIAVVITVIMEFLHVPGLFTKLSRDHLDLGFQALQKSFANVFPKGSSKEAKKAVDDALSEAAGKIADAELYNVACKMEPRLWMCPWKTGFVDATAGHLKRIRLDMVLIQRALCGLDGKMEDMVELLGKVPEVAHMRKDLDDTMEDARKLAIGLLAHEYDKFLGLDNLATVEGLDELDGFEEAVKGTNQFIKSDDIPVTMEDDHGVRLSIVFIMLQYLIQHVAAITQDAVKLS